MADSETSVLEAGADLTIVDGPGRGRLIRVPLGASRVLGRDESADEHLGGDTTISRRHAKLEHLRSGRLCVVDLDSTNGVFVGGRRITEPTEIGPGERVELGQTALLLQAVHDDAPHGAQRREAPVAGYLDVAEEWEGSVPERAFAKERVAPPSSPRPQPPAHRMHDAVATVRRHGRGHVRGTARSVQLRTSESESVLSFRVEQYDAAGDRVQPVGVELQMYRSGQLSDGEEVDVRGRWKRGTLQADRVVNRTTGAHVKGISRWVRYIAATVVLIFFCFVIAFVAYGFATNLPIR
jgi:hypothetical protein